MKTALQDEFKDAIEALGQPVAFPNVDFSPTGPYYRVSYLGGVSEPDTLGCDRIPSIIQVDAVEKDGDGYSLLVDTILNTFTKNQQFTNFRIDRSPYTSAPIQDAGWFFTPISIPIEVFR